MPPDTDHVVDELLQWCSTHGIQIDSRICVTRGEDGGISVLTRHEVIEPRTTLVNIPKSAILSIRNCFLAEHIPQVIYGKEAQLGLSLALFGELLRGDSSPWSGYLQSLPKRVSIALLWDDTNAEECTALKWIKGTMADVNLLASSQADDVPKYSEHMVMDLLRYFELTVIPALKKAKLEKFATMEDFKHAYALVSSRSFVVDVYHGLAMVPIADAFNHSLDNHVHLESDRDVCYLCGSLNECAHDSEDEGKDDILTERLDHTLAEPSILENTCEMVTNASVPPYNEVFNTYGEGLTNANLLLQYGFLLDINENDVILWDTRLLCLFVERFIKCSAEDSEFRDADPNSVNSEQSYDVLDDKAMRIEGKVCIPLLPRDDKRACQPLNAIPSDEDQTLEIDFGQVLLERLREVVELWACGDFPLLNSSLVYTPSKCNVPSYLGSFWEDAILQSPDTFAYNATSSAVDGNIEAGNGDAHHLESDSTAGLRDHKRHSPSYFAMDDEAKISQHLWIFCVLLALHATQLPLHNMPFVAAEAPQKMRTENSTPPGTYGGELCSTFAPSGPIYASGGVGSLELRERHGASDTQRVRLWTNVEEDVAVLRRIIPIHVALEETSLEAGESDIDNESGQIRTRSINECGKSTKHLVEDAAADAKAPYREERGAGTPEAHLEVPTTIISAARRREAESDGSRKRIRRPSTGSTGSNQSDGTRSRIRVRRSKRVCVKERDIPRGADDEDKDNIEAKLGPLKEPHGVANGGGQGVLLALLHNYGNGTDESEGETFPSALGVGLREGSQRQGYLGCMDTRASPSRKLEPELDPNFPGKLPVQSHSYGERYSADTASSSSAIGGSGSSASLGATKLKLENVPKGHYSEDALSDASGIVCLVASTARVVRALCAARTRYMAYPNLGASELGEVVDTILPEMTQACMAAQLALAERTRLEGCAAAWTEIELAASRQLSLLWKQNEKFQ